MIEDGTGSQMSEWELRELREREEEQEVEAEELGAAEARALGRNYRSSCPHPPSWHRQVRSRGTGCAFLCFFPLLISLGASTLCWDKPGQRAKGELATSRHCADCGQENRAKCTPS